MFKLAHQLLSFLPNKVCSWFNFKFRCAVNTILLCTYICLYKCEWLGSLHNTICPYGLVKTATTRPTCIRCTNPILITVYHWSEYSSALVLSFSETDFLEEKVWIKLQLMYSKRRLLKWVAQYVPGLLLWRFRAPTIYALYSNMGIENDNPSIYAICAGWTTQENGVCIYSGGGTLALPYFISPPHMIFSFQLFAELPFNFSKRFSLLGANN